MVHPDSLIKKFQDAGLRLQILKSPIQGSSEDIIQIDVGRSFKNGGRRYEWIRLFPGNNETNTVQVKGIDKHCQQLVLVCQEPERAFEIDRPKYKSTSPPRVPRAKYLRETKTHWIYEQKTVSDVRHYLVGVDERQLFIAQTTEGVSTVQEAQRSLGSSVQFFEGKKKMKRQGEWFFIDASDKEKQLQILLDDHLVYVGQTGRIGNRGGNPHIADEMIVVPPQHVLDRLEHGFSIRPTQIYVRGAVRHQDHKTLKFSHWQEVIANSESRETARLVSGGSLFID